MRWILFIVWSVLAAGWVSAFLFLASMVGGARWLTHMGYGGAASLNIAMAVLCGVTALFVLRVQRVPIPLLMATALLGALHMFNGVGSLLLVSTNGHIGATNPALMWPFYVVGLAVRTNPMFVGLAGNWQYIALPCATLAGALLSWLARSQSIGRLVRSASGA